MKYFRKIKNSLTHLVACTALLSFVACVSDDAVVDPVLPEKELKGVVAVVPPLEFIDDSRSSLVFGSGGMKFAWSEDDAITVFAHGNDEARQEYRLRSGAGTLEATFVSQDFSLMPGKRYYAVSMTEKTSDHHAYLPDQHNITFNYGGQVQKGNASPNHLGKYDFLVASGKCERQDNMHLKFDRLGATLRISARSFEGVDDEVFKNTRFTSIEIYHANNEFYQQIRPFSFMTGYNEDHNTYATIWTSQDYMTTTPVKDHFVLKLQSKDGDDDGVKPSEDHIDLTNNNSRLIAYIELPPFDFTAGTLGFIFKGKYGDGADAKDVAYYASYDDPLYLRMNKALQVNLNVKKTTDYDVTIKLNQNWQHGVASRGTGDPGVTNELPIPEHLYYILCVNGTVKAVAPIGDAGGSEKAVNYIHVDGNTGGSWSKAQVNGNTICTYSKKLTFNMTDVEVAQKKRLYVIASREPLDIFSSITDATGDILESTVKALTYSISNKAASPEKNHDLDDSQLFLRDLYTTVWESGSDTTFTGNIEQVTQDVVLYHTAAMVDLMWDSPTALTGDVSVTNVNSTGLSLFTPTDAGCSDADYTVTASITPETNTLGRQVFYLPQYASYTGTIGTAHPSETFTFSPYTANGFTSWLRWMKKYPNP